MASVVPLPVVIGPSLTVEQAREIYARGEEAVIFVSDLKKKGRYQQDVY